MHTKSQTFDDLPMPDDITLELEWVYSFDPGQLTGPFENCYPPSEESEICLPMDWELIVIAEYQRAGIAAIQEIKKRAEAMEWDGTPAEWAHELAEAMEDY